ncbi:TatD family hydrolase [Timonella sp. A28]|uniref:TatD family hydrolase n=1 Tax=Timonella sp. A28 TaxID=3442640 RepID=UPI003EBBE0F5
MRELPPLDVHAHVAVDIEPIELERLGAVVLVATRSLAEFDKVRDRHDRVSIWGVGCHPSLVRAQGDYDQRRFAEAIESTPYVSEVGLDGDSRVPMKRQIATLGSILDVLDHTPRILSLHSYRAGEEILDILEAHGNQPGRVLHWWLGDSEQTARALALGCYFSVNYSMIRANDGWKSIPLDRLLVETDHPSGDRFGPVPRMPGRVQPVEVALAKHHGLSQRPLRTSLWENFAAIVAGTGTYSILPKPVQLMADASSGA